jgi:hypothetical protein
MEDETIDLWIDIASTLDVWNSKGNGYKDDSQLNNPGWNKYTMWLNHILSGMIEEVDAPAIGANGSLLLLSDLDIHASRIQKAARRRMRNPGLMLNSDGE